MHDLCTSGERVKPTTNAHAHARHATRPFLWASGKSQLSLVPRVGTVSVAAKPDTTPTPIHFMARVESGCLSEVGGLPP
jgi:hypothetical protein